MQLLHYGGLCIMHKNDVAKLYTYKSVMDKDSSIAAT